MRDLSDRNLYYKGQLIAIIEVIDTSVVIEYLDNSGKIETIPYWELDSDETEVYDSESSNIISFSFRKMKCQKRKSQNEKRQKRLHQRRQRLKSL